VEDDKTTTDVGAWPLTAAATDLAHVLVLLAQKPSHAHVFTNLTTTLLVLILETGAEDNNEMG